MEITSHGHSCAPRRRWSATPLAGSRPAERPGRWCTAHVNDDGVIHAAQIACGPRMEFVGSACDGQNRVTARVINSHERPSFWDRYTSASVMPRSAKLFAKPSVKRQQPGGAQRSKWWRFAQPKPMEPISLEMEMRIIVAEHFAGNRGGGELVIVAHAGKHAANGDRFDLFFTPSKKGAARSPHRSRPNACRQFKAAANKAVSTATQQYRRTNRPWRNAHRSRCADAQDGNRANPLRSTMAFVHCVVPSIACLMSLRSMFAGRARRQPRP